MEGRVPVSAWSATAVVRQPLRAFSALERRDLVRAAVLR
jgi:hypothetical protein